MITVSLVKKSFRRSVFVGWLILAGSVTAFAANTAAVTSVTSTYTPAGGTISFNVALGYTTSLSGLDLQLRTPSGWRFVSATGANVPQAIPSADDLGSFGLGFVYTSIPASPASFTFTLSYPAGMTGAKSITNIQVSFTDEATSVVSVVNVPNITINAAPPPITITTPPANQTVVVGGNATFTVVATGDPTPASFTWQRSTDGGATWSNVPNSAPFSGGTTNTLAIGAATVEFDGNRFRVIVANGVASDVTSESVLLTVGKASQTITFGPLSSKTYGDAPFALAATASSGLAVTFVSSSPEVATISGSTVTIVGGGNTTITAKQAGNASYGAAADVSQSLAVARASQVISFSAVPQKTFGDPSFSLNATASSGLPVSFGVSDPNVATVAGNTLTIAGAGSVTVTASQGGNTNYLPANPVNVAVTVGKANQTISFAPLAPKVMGAAPFPLSATASSGLQVVYSSSNTNVATVSGATVTMVGPGATTITASQPGNLNYNAALPVERTLEVALSDTPPTVLTPPPNRVIGIGTGTTIGVAAGGTQPLTYLWKKNGSSLEASSRITGITTATLGIADATLDDSGNYTVTVTNSVGSVTSSLSDGNLTVVDVRASHAVLGPGYVAGGTVRISNTVSYAGDARAFGWFVNLPAGWSYAYSDGSQGDTKPEARTTSLLEWAWTNTPSSPFTFTYTLNVPAGATGPHAVSSLLVFRKNGINGPVEVVAKPDLLTIASAPPVHSADTSDGNSIPGQPNSAIDLLELTRVIQLYNTRHETVRTGAYKLMDTSEDGFAPDPVRSNSAAATLARYHSADTGIFTGSRDAKIDLVELTRVIELYNYRVGTQRTGEYHVHPNTEDGFAPGPASLHPAQ